MIIQRMIPSAMMILSAVLLSACTTTYRMTYDGSHNLNESASSAARDTKPGNPDRNSPDKSAPADKVVYLTDGSEIRGEIVSQTRTAVTVKTKYATMTIEKKNIREIKYK